MEPDFLFRYRPMCSASGCPRHAIFKIAASWSDGTSHELKSYGLVCDTHLREQLAQACHRSAMLSCVAEEVIGPVEVFQLMMGRRDADLSRFLA